MEVNNYSAHVNPNPHYLKTIDGRVKGMDMGWWPFSRSKSKLRVPDVIRRDTRSWLTDLQEICERNFDSPEEARRQIRQMQVEWSEANAEGVMDDALHEGLKMRAFRLLKGDDDEFSQWLDNLEFWKPGWRPEGSRSTEDS